MSKLVTQDILDVVNTVNVIRMKLHTDMIVYQHSRYTYAESELDHIVDNLLCTLQQDNVPVACIEGEYVELPF